MYRTGPVSSAVQNTASAQGFDTPSPVSDRPHLPPDITVLDSDELMTLFVELTEYSNYAATQLAFAEIDEKHALGKAADKHNELMAAASGAGASKVTFQKSQANANPEYLALRDEADFASAYRTLMKTVYENLDRDARVVSREVSRRISSPEPRASRWST